MSQNATITGSSGTSAKAALLAKWKRGEQAESASAPERVIPRRANPSTAPLSYAQRGLWFFHQLELASPLYNIPVAAEFSGELNLPALQSAFDAVIARHEMFRTRILVKDASPLQVIDPPVSVPIRVVDLSAKAQREEESKRLLSEEVRRPFELTTDLLIRILVIKLDVKKWIVLTVMDHIASDLLSWHMLGQELAVFYQAASEGRTAHLPPLVVQYGDFAAWETERLNNGVAQKNLTYWKKQLQDAPPLLALPADHPRPVRQTFRGDSEYLILPDALARQVRALSQRENVSLFMSLLAAFQTLVYRLTGQTDVVLGSPMADRGRVELEPLIGFFVNTLVMRTNLAGDPGFRELLRRARTTVLEAVAHREVPFEKLVEELRPERSTSHAPLVQVVFAYHALAAHSFQLPGLSATPLHLDTGTAKFELTFSVLEKDGTLTCRAEYSTDLFTQVTIRRILQQYQRLLEGIVTDPGRRLSEFSILNEMEEHQLLSNWNEAGPLPEKPIISRADSSLVKIQPVGFRSPLFLVHGAGGGILWGYANLAKHLSHNQPVYAFESRGMRGLEEYARVEDMAAVYIKEMREVQPEGPYYLGGYCFGGNVAYEMGCQLIAQGEKIAFLCLIDSSAPNSSFEKVPWWRPVYWPRFAKNTGHWLEDFFELQAEERRDFIMRKIKVLGKKIGKLWKQHETKNYYLEEFINTSLFPDHELRLWQNHLKIGSHYHPRPFPGQVHLFRTQGQPLLCSLEPHYGWGDLADSVQVKIIPGAHEQIFRDPYVQFLASEIEFQLAGALRAAQPSVPNGGETQQIATTMTLSEKSTPVIDNGSENFSASAGAALAYRRDRCLHQLFEEQVVLRPETVALVVGREQFSYRELNARANRLAHHLISLGVKPESLVAICLNRSLDMVVGLLAVLKAGGAYVPLDPVYPKDRLQFILEDARAFVILTQSELVDGLPRHQASVVCLDQLDVSVGNQENPRTAVTTDNLAYVIFTSGSTGRPKGVAIEHRSTLVFTEWARTIFSVDDLAGVMFSTSICFDLSVFELFVTLGCGGKVILAENALQLPTLPRASEVTLINTVPSAIAGLLRMGPLPATVRIVNLAGEPLAQSLVEKIYQNSSVEKVYDLYGPSEDTTYSTFALRTRGGVATIGRPIANTQVYLLDDKRQPVPQGEAGELYLGGEGLARGYLYRPELTAEKFLPNLFSTESGARMYRTGDLARYFPDGNIEYLGRIDHQVKIRGFRIELGEIEAVLEKVSTVDQAVLMAREETGEKKLVAYIVGRGTEKIAIEALRNGIRAKLPDYMMPSAFVVLDKMPLTPNGKVDRKALPVPDIAAMNEESFVAPKTDEEKLLAKIWAEVLGLKRVGAEDNFFELGGHSLLAVQVISRVRDELYRELTLADLFKVPTVAALAAFLGSRRAVRAVAPIARADRAEKLPLSFIQQQLWFLQQLDPASVAYNMPMAIRLTGILDEAAFGRALVTVVQRHEVLRSRFPAEDGHPVLVVSNDEILLEQLDLRHEQDGEARAWQMIQAEAVRPFDLAKGPLLRAKLLRFAADDYFLLVVMHHIVSDGWSLGIFFREWGEFYQAYAQGRPASPPELPLQYADFSLWQQQIREEKDVHYWQHKLAGAPARLVLPVVSTASKKSTATAGQVTLSLPEKTVNDLRVLARREGSTLFISLMTGLVIALERWTQQSEFVIGTVAAGRNRREFESLIGCFMNFLPLRFKLAPGQTAQDILHQVKETVLGAQAHQDCPFEKIVHAVNPVRKGQDNPLYNVAFLLQNYPKNMLGTDLLRAESMPMDVPAALLDLRFVAEETEGQIALTCEFRESLFTAETIRSLLEFISKALETLAFEPERKIADFQLDKFLAKQKSIVAEIPCLAITGTFTLEPLEESLRFWMDKLNFPAAISFAPYNQVFQQLLDPASLLGANQQGLNVVLVRLEDWLKTESANVRRHADELIDALKATAARSSVPYLVCFCPPSKSAVKHRDQIELFHRIESEVAAELAGLPRVSFVTTAELTALYPVADYDDPQSNELGHIPYTPACYAALGTLIARKFHVLHRAPFKVIALDCDNTLWTGICGEDGARGIMLDPVRITLQKFMRGQQEAGMLLCLCTKNNQADVDAVFSTRKEMPLQAGHFVASRVNWRAKSENLKALAKELNLGLDSFIFVDDNAMECAEVEAHCPEVLAVLLPKAEQIPDFLEHCWAFDHENVTGEDRQRTTAYQQNRQREQFQAKAGGLAEFIAGLDLKVRLNEMAEDQLSRVAQLTQRTNQFNCTSRRRSESDLRQLQRKGYQILTVSVTDRFGDYGLVGAVIYQAASDSIVVDTFLLSCRVLGKGVEHQMLVELGHAALKTGAATVEIQFDSTAKNRPALDFLEKADASSRTESGFCFPAKAAAQLKFNPAKEAMIKPATLEKSSAKLITPAASTLYSWIARESSTPAMVLAAIEEGASSAPGKQGNFVSPRTDLEKQLCHLWEQLLRVKRVGIHDDFFDLGGHSMLAVRLFAQIHKLTGKNLPLVTLFQSPTVEQLAAALQQKGPEDSLLVPLQAEGQRPPFFLIHGAGGGILWGYANLAKHLAPDQPVYGLESRGMRGLEEFETVEQMAAHYIEQLRSVQPEGPYYLGGYCFGGSIAYEMARQLRTEGETVAFLALIDAAAPNGSYDHVPWWQPEYLPRFVKNTFYWLADFVDLQPEERRDFYQRKARALKKRLGLQLHHNGETNGHYRDLEGYINVTLFPEHELKLWQVHLQADRNYRPQPYPGHATLFRTRGQPLFCSLDPAHGWNELATEGVDIQLVQGAHEQIFMEPSVQRLATQIQDRLHEAQARHLPHELTPTLV